MNSTASAINNFIASDPSIDPAFKKQFADKPDIKSALFGATPDQLIEALQEKINDLPFCEYDRIHKKSDAYGSNYIRHEAIERKAALAVETIIDTFNFFKENEL